MVDTPTNPKNWPWTSSTAVCVGLDVGMAQDHSALVAAGAWQSGTRSILGVKEIVQFKIGMSLDDVADEAARVARELRARLVFDSSNNSAFASILAARLGKNPADSLVAGVITQALDHAAQPVPMILSVGGIKTAILRWTLSKRELIESTAAEIDGKTLRLGRVGEWEALRDELGSMERTVRQSGSVAYSAPAGKHDDLVLALSLAVFGLRRIGVARRRVAPQRAGFSHRAWT